MAIQPQKNISVVSAPFGDRHATSTERDRLPLTGFSARVTTILAIIMEHSREVDSIRTGHIAFHFTEGSEVKPKLHNEMVVVLDGNLATRTT